MKHFFRVFTIFLVIFFSISAKESYGQTGVTLSIDKTIICPGENIFISAISTDRPYPYVLIYVSDDNITFRPLFTPDPSFPLSFKVYEPGDPSTVFNYQTAGSNFTTTLKRLYYKVALWTSKDANGNPTGNVAYSNTVYVDVRPAANIQNGFNNANQRVCINSNAAALSPISPVGTSYSWYKRAPGESVYSPITAYQNVTNPTLPTSAIPTNIVGRTYFRLVASYGADCSSDASSTYLDVDEATVSGTVSISSGTATICANTTAPTLTLTGNTGSILNWSSSSTLTGTYATIPGTSTPTISNTSSAYYKVTVQSGVCPSASSTPFFVTVNTASNAGTITPVTQTICYNAIPAAITLTGYTGTIQWQSSLTTSGGYSDIAGQTSATLPSGSISNTTTMYYQAVVTNGVCPSATITATVNVNPTSVGGIASIASGTATICANTTAPTITLAGNVGTVVWQSSNTSGSGFVDISGTTSPSVSNTATKYYRAKVTSGGCSIAYSNEVLVTVNQISNAGTITPVTQTICYNAVPAAITISSYIGTIQWQSSLTSSGGYSDIAGQTSATLVSGSISNTTTMYYQALVTNGVCPSATITATVNISPTTLEGTAAITAGNATICSNTTAPTITLTGSVGTVQWLKSGTLTGTYVVVAGTTTPTISNTSSAYYKASVKSGVCLTRETTPILISVDPVSNYGTINVTTQNICYNATPTALTLTGYTGTIQWQSTNIAGGTYSDMVGQTMATLPSIGIDNTATGYYKAVVTSGVCTPVVINSTVNVTALSSAGVATITSGNSTICSNTSGPTINLTGSVVGTVQWWDRPASSGTLSQNNASGATAPTINLTTSKYYKAIVTNGICPAAISNEILVSVDQASSAGTISPSTQTICYSGSPADITLTGSVGNVQWQTSSTSAGTYTNMVGLTASILPSASIDNLNTAFYKAVVVNGVCAAATITATVNVDPTTVSGTASIASGTATICASTSAPVISLTGNTGSVQWQYSTTSPSSGFTNTTGTSNPLVDNTTTKYYRALVTSGKCASAPSNAILVTVDQISRTGTISPSTQTICYSGSPADITLTGSVGNVQWQTSSTSGGTYTNMVGLTASILPSASIDNLNTAFYKAVVVNGVCAAATITATVSVNPTTVAGTATLAGTSTICYGAVPGALPSISLTGNTGTIQWQSSLTSGGVFSNSGGTTSPVIDNGTSKYYRALVTSGVCASIASNELFVSVDQPSAPGNISPSSQDICIGNAPTPISLTGYLGTIQWQSSTTNSAGTFTNMVGETSSGLIASAIDNTNSKYYQAIVKNGVCPATPSLVAAVKISQLPVAGTVNLTGNSTVCYGTTGIGLPIITLTGSSGTIQWQSSSSSGGVYSNTTGTTSPFIDNTATKYYQAKVSSGPCGSATSIPIVVNVDPLSVAGSISNPTPRICQAGAPTDLTLTGYTGTIQWQIASSPSGTYSNMTGLTNAIYPAASINNTNSTIYNAVVTSGVCPSATISSTVLVDPTSSAGTASLTGTSTVCYGTVTASLPVITLSGNVGTIQWQSSPTSNGVYSNSAGTTSAVIDNTSSKYYKAKVTSGVCTSDFSTPILVSVDPTSQVGLISPTQKIQEWCIGSPALDVVLPSYTGAIVWKTAISASGTYSDIAGQTAATLPSVNIPTNVAGTLYYKAVVKSGVCPAIESDIVSVQTDAATVAGTIASTSNLICNGTTPPTISLTGNTGSTIQWQTRLLGASYVNPIASQNGTSISSVVNNAAPGILQVVNYYQAIVKSGVCNSLTTNEVVVAVDPTSKVGSIVAAQKTQEVCINSPATGIVLPTNVGTIIWQTANAPAGTYSTITGQTAATLPSGLIPTNIAGTKTYRAQVTSGVCPSIYSDIATVQTDAATVAGTIASTSNLICNGTTPPTISLTGNTGSTIQWQTRLLGASYVNPIASQNGTSISSVVNNAAPGSLQVVNYYQAIVKSGVCNSLTTNEVLVAVDPSSQVGTIIPAQKTQEVCIGSPASSVVLPTNVGTIIWQTSNAPAGIFNTIVGQTTATLPTTNIPTTAAGVLYYRAVVTSGICPSINSDIVSVQTDGLTVPGTISTSAAVICNNSAAPTISLTGNTGSNINWKFSNDGATFNNFTLNQTGTSINSVVNNAAPGTTQLITYYKAVIQNGVCPNQSTNILTVSVDPTSKVGSILPAQKTQEVCIGSPATGIVLPSNVGTIQWQTANSLTGYEDIMGQTTAILPSGSIPTNVAGTLYYRAVVTSGVCPSIYSDVANVQTDAATLAGDIYYVKGSSPICNFGDKPTMTIKNNVGNTIVWQMSSMANAASILATANSLSYGNTNDKGNILNAAIDNTAPGAVSSFKYYRAAVTNGVCKTEYTSALELEVIPTPVLTKITPGERCGPGFVDLQAVANLGTPNWFEASTGGTLIASGNNFTTPFLNTSTNYYAGAIFRGCVSFNRTAVLAKIKPIPTITSVTDTTNCGPGLLNLHATASDGVVNWFADSTGGNTLFTALKYTTPLLKKTTTFYAQALLDGCISNPRAPVVATIFEVPVVTPLPDLFSLCNGLNVSLKNNASLGVPPYVYTFYTNNGNVIGQKDGYLSAIKKGVTNVYFNVKDMNGCVSQNTNSFQFKIYDPILPQRFNYQAFYKDDYVIPTKLDSGYVDYNWQPGLNLNFYDKPNPIFNGENSTDYVLIRTDTTTKCTVADNYHIDVTRDFIFDLPNAFTPNYDGLNDVLRIIANEGIESVESFTIINRSGISFTPRDNFGNKISFPLTFSSRTRDMNFGNGWEIWDGKDSNGKVQEADGYYWFASYRIKGKSGVYTKKGSFILLK